MSIEYIPDQHIHERWFYLWDLLDPEDLGPPYIDDREVTDCDIYGPAMMAVSGHTDLVDCSWDGTWESQFVMVEEGQIVVGAFSLRNCRFRRCRFHDIGILATPELRQKFIEAHRARQHASDLGGNGEEDGP